MFELSVALKYLIPKRKQLSVTLIAIMSVAVISLVVWLLLVFLSITEGMETTWLKKLTDLNAPVRITPTSQYYSSYYYKVDSLSSASGFSYKTIGEKQQASISDPYNPEEDQEVPSLWPDPVMDEKGNLIDPVKGLFSTLENLRPKHPGVIFQDYEMSGALLKLQLLRSQSPSMPGNETLNFLTQVSYLATLPGHAKKIEQLSIAPTAKDINHLFFLANYRLEGCSTDSAPEVMTSWEGFSEKIHSLLQYITIHKLKSAMPYWHLPSSLYPEEKAMTAYLVFKENEPHHILIPNNPSSSIEHSLLSYTKMQKGLLKKIGTYFEFSYEGEILDLSHTIPLLVDMPLYFDVDLIQESVEKARQLKDLHFRARSSLQGQTLSGILAWKDLVVEDFSLQKHLSSQPQSPPPFLYQMEQSGQTETLLPVNTKKEAGILLPKSFRDNGVLLGDRGFLSYAASTSSAVQEQRLAVFVAGFYDPGILSVGNKCILVPSSITRTINTSNTSFTFDKIALNGVQVWFDDLQQASSIKKEIESALAAQNIHSYWTVTSFQEYDFAKDLLQQFQSDKYLFSLVGLIILVVACCNIISLLVLLVNDKKKEIGILQAMGANTKSIALIFGTCGMIVGILGSAIGIVAALLTLGNIDSLVQMLSALQGHDAFNAAFYGTSLPNQLSSNAVWFILITTPLLSLCAGLVPAVKACRLRPSAILRSEI